jgi:hypothetical protein
MGREGDASSGAILIKLPAGSGVTSQAFPVRFIYEIPSPGPGQRLPMSGSMTMPVPALIDNIPVLESSHTLYFPPTADYTSFTGPMEPDLYRLGWNQWRRLLDGVLPGVGPSTRVEQMSEAADMPPLPPEAAAGFTFDVPREGRVARLSRLGAPATTEVGFRSRRLTFFLEAGLGLAGFLAGMALWKRSLACRTGFLLVAGGLALLLSLVLQPSNALICNYLFVGLVLAWLATLAIGVFRWFASIRKGPPPPAPPTPSQTPEPPDECPASDEPVKPAPESKPPGEETLPEVPSDAREISEDKPVVTDGGLTKVEPIPLEEKSTGGTRKDPSPPPDAPEASGDNQSTNRPS